MSDHEPTRPEFREIQAAPKSADTLLEERRAFEEYKANLALYLKTTTEKLKP